MTASGGSDPLSTPEIAAASVEIRTHLAALVFIVLPIAGVVLPALLMAIAAYMALHLVPSLGVFAEANWLLQFIACVCVMAGIGAAAATRAFVQAQGRTDRRLRPLAGALGEQLTTLVQKLWQGAGQNPTRVPAILYFSNFNVMANVATAGERMELHVSSTLWERATRCDPVATGILAHEVAHLAFRDPLRFRLLESVAAMFRVGERVVKATILVVAFALVGNTLFQDFASRNHAAVAASHLAAGVVFAALAYWAATALGFAGRRYSALVVALLELRADVGAGILTGGLQAFGAALARDSSVLATSIKDLYRSLLSPSLTHLSVGERTDFLARPERLRTPKLRYFALLLLLVLLLPLNPVTPLIFGGALDHLLATAANVALQMATVAMIIVGGRGYELGIVRALTIAVMLVVAGIIPHINLFVVGYLLFSIAAQLAVPGGVGGVELSAASLYQDLRTTWGDLSGEVWTAADGFGGLVALTSTTMALLCLSHMACSGDHAPRCRFLSVCAAVVFAVLSSYDEWRNGLYRLDPFEMTRLWVEHTDHIAWIRLSAPAIAASLVFFVGRRARRATVQT